MCSTASSPTGGTTKKALTPPTKDTLMKDTFQHHTPTSSSSITERDLKPTSVPQSTTIKKSRSNTSLDSTGKKKKKRNTSGDGFSAGLLAIGIYALMHESGIMTILLLAFVWWYSLEESHQRIFLFFLVVLNFAEYFYLLPPVLARYQKEDWWDVPTIKTALFTMGIFWSIAWVSAYTGSYLEQKEQRLKLEREQRRLSRIAMALETSKDSPTASEGDNASSSLSAAAMSTKDTQQ